MRLGTNLVAGLASSVWTALIGLAVVPFYLKFLGIEAYGLIGFFSTMQALFQILDLGLAPAMNREAARHSALGNLRDSGTLLHTLTIIYWGSAAAIASSIFVAAPYIAGDWLSAKSLAPEAVTRSLMLMGLIVACRWPIGLYLGALMGAQRLAISSSINIVAVAVANGGAICVLAFFSPTIQAFFVWQAAVALLYALSMRWAAWNAIGTSAGLRFDFAALKRVWAFSAGMAAVAISGLIFTQLDKVLLSRIISLAAFGEYALAVVVTNSLALLIMPTFNVIYPRFSALVAGGHTAQLISLYRLGTRFLAAILLPGAMFLAVFSEELIGFWTGNKVTAAHVAPLIALLAVGSAANGVMHFPYALQLAHGNTRLPLTINGIILAVMIPATIALARTYGAAGGAAAWLASQLMYLLLGTWMTHRRFLVGLGGRWLVEDVGIPLLLTSCAGVFGEYAIQGSDHSPFFKLACGATLTLLATLLSLASSPALRRAAYDNLGRIGHGLNT